MPTLAIVHNNIDDRTSIGSIAAWDAREAIARGWDVLAVCRDLDPSLADVVTHLPLYVPPRLHLVQYAAGRATVRRALRGHSPDVLVTHQPQTAAIADIWNVHYLEHAAHDAVMTRPSGLKATLVDAQSRAVVALEDRYLRQVRDRTRILFCGDGVRNAFESLYGPHPNSAVVYNPAPPHSAARVDGTDRRRAVIGSHEGPVIGFLGGGDLRKGADLISAAVRHEPELFLIHAGPSPLADGPGLLERSRGLGNLADVNDLLDLVDVLVVPSRFDPFPLVVMEAIARGVPVVVSPAVGSAELLVETGAGAVWDGHAPLTPLVRAIAQDRGHHLAGGKRFLSALDRDGLADARFAEFDRLLHRGRR